MHAENDIWLPNWCLLLRSDSARHTYLAAIADTADTRTLGIAVDNGASGHIAVTVDRYGLIEDALAAAKRVLGLRDEVVALHRDGKILEPSLPLAEVLPPETSPGAANNRHDLKQGFELRLEIKTHRRMVGLRGGLGSRQEQRQLRTHFDTTKRQLATNRRANEATMHFVDPLDGHETVQRIPVTPLPLLVINHMGPSERAELVEKWIDGMSKAELLEACLSCGQTLPEKCTEDIARMTLRMHYGSISGGPPGSGLEDETAVESSTHPTIRLSNFR
eukprot:SAG31_NODE_3136_length_4636_cov_1.969583_2_plen_276_part_00